MITVNEINSLLDIISDSSNIILIPHNYPDPDALSSSYAFAIFLNRAYPDKLVKVGLQSFLSAKNRSIFGKYENYNIYGIYDNDKFDLAIILDIGEFSRIGLYAKYLDISNMKLVNIDHHIDNDSFGYLNILHHKASSTCELVYQIIKHCDKLNNEINYLLYLGIVSDTGSFKYDLTTSYTHLVVHEILSKNNISTEDVYFKLFENIKYENIEVRKSILNQFKLLCNDQVSMVLINHSLYRTLNITSYENSFTMNLGLSIGTVKLFLYIREIDRGKFKFSLRSKGAIKVNEIASNYSGGGHFKAAGFILNLGNKQSIDNIINDIINLYKKQLVS